MPKVVVAGSVNMDVVAQADRQPRPGETILGTSVAFLPGGKGANQAVAAVMLGVDTLLAARVGADAFGSQLRAFLHQTGVQLDFLAITDSAATGTALITVSSDGENSIVVVPGANGLLSPADIASLPIDAHDVLVAQFETPLPTIEAFFRKGRSKNARTILNPAPAQTVPREILAATDILVLNETELEMLAGQPVSAESAVDIALALRTSSGQTVVLTLGKDGVLAIENEVVHRVDGRKVAAVDTTGAGDCFVGALASRLAKGMPLPSALAFANKAAAISVQRLGAGPSMPTEAEVDAWLD